MRHEFIINPVAGKRRDVDALVERIHAACRGADLDYTVSTTECPGDAVRITRALAQEGVPTRIYACGGDGTLSEVVQAAAGVPHLAVTNVPTGTGNDFLKIFGPDFRSLFSDFAALAQGPQTPMDLIDCNGRLGLDIVCAGVDARVADGVHRFDALPLVKGKGSYILSLLDHVLLHDIARPMRVTMGGQTWDEPISILCICNGRYYGGGFMPVGEAMPDDGILDTLLVPRVSRTTFFRLVGKYAKGGYAQYPDLIHAYHGPDPISFSAPDPITVVVDGETLRDTQFTVSLSEKKLNFFYPAGASWRPDPPQEAKEASATAVGS